MATRKLRTVEPGIVIMELSGRLNVGKSLTETEKAIYDVIATGTRKLILDFAHLNYVDSTSIGVLTGCRNAMHEAGGQIRIAGAHGSIAQVFQVMQMHRIIPLDADVAAAQANL